MLKISAPKACKIIDITYRQLDYWVRTNLVIPSISDGKGSGSQRLFSFEDLLKLKIIKSMLDAGLNLKKIRQCINYCEDVLDKNLSSCSIVFDSTNSMFIQDDVQLLDAIKHGQGVLNILPLESLSDKLKLEVSSNGESRSQLETEVAGQLKLLSS
jgi:DNA-binding transcriptional MerR regulator